MILAGLASIPKPGEEIPILFPFGLGDEGTVYGTAINSILKEAGFKTAPAVVPMKIVPGLFLAAKDSTSPPWASTMLQAFLTAGIKIQVTIAPDIVQNTNLVGIIIGQKPSDYPN